MHRRATTAYNQLNGQLETLTRESTAAEKKHQREQKQLNDKLTEVERQLAHKQAEAAAAARQADQQQAAFQKLMADHETLKANSAVGAVWGMPLLLHAMLVITLGLARAWV